MKIKYKITGAFGSREEGEIINAFLLTRDDDRNIGLCYHPKNKRLGECGSFEFVKELKDGIWINAFKEEHYVNQGSSENTDKTFRKFLETARSGTADLTHRINPQRNPPLPASNG